VELIVNGKKQQLDVRTIEDVIVHFGLIGKPVVVEADGEVLMTEQWPHTMVRSGMTIELVHFVGGG